MPTVTWSTAAAQRLADLISLQDDLDFILLACQRLLTMDGEMKPDPVVARALWSASLVAYSRCWATGTRVGLPIELLDSFDGDPHGFHNHMLQLRNKHIAHSVNPFEDVRVGLVLSPEEDENRAVVGVAQLLQKLVGFEHEALIHLGTLVTAIRNAVSEMFDEQKDVVLKEGQAASWDDIIKKPPVGLVTPSPHHVADSRLKRSGS
jgi:hypothetical protein